MFALALLLASSAQAMPPVGSGRLAVGVGGAVGVAPIDATWNGEAVPRSLGCASGTGWWLYGGHTYAGQRGEVKRADDTWRIGGEGAVCPLSGGGQSGGVGFGLGRQWGGHIYLTSYAHVGVSAYTKEGPGGDRYSAFAPYVSPTLALGLTLMPGFTVEAGPYFWFAPPVLQVVEGRAPSGLYLGHGGLEATVMFGNGSPKAYGGQ